MTTSGHRRRRPPLHLGAAGMLRGGGRRSHSPDAASAALLLALLLLGGAGCAEMRTAPPGEGALQLAPPGTTGDPVRGTALAAAADFVDLGRALAGRPERAALAAARLEYLAAEIPDNPRFAPMTPSIGFALRGARDELRAALGTREGAGAAPVIRDLAAAAAALRAGNAPAAAQALPAAQFDPGGAETVQRLGELGPLPRATEATQLVAREMARLDADQRWFGTMASDPAVGGITTTGIGTMGY